MGYYTQSHNMAATQFNDQHSAAMFLLEGRNQDLLGSLKITEQQLNAYAERQENGDWLDEGTFNETFGIWPDDVINKVELQFEYEGDARMDVESGWLGLKTSQMGGNETRNQFVDRVRGVLKTYSNQDADVEIASFSYTS